MSLTIYTFGYRGRTMADLVSVAMEHNAVVVDVRFNPFTKLPGWGLADLKKALGDRYVWSKAFGNKNYMNSGPVTLVDYVSGVERIGQILKAERSPILLCACDKLEVCHRKVVAEKLEADAGLPVVHLAAKPAPRGGPGLLER